MALFIVRHQHAADRCPAADPYAGAGLLNLMLRARATDLAGRTQPDAAEWNRLGYGNNAIQQVPIRIV